MNKFATLIGKHIVLRKAKESDYLSMLKNVWGDEAVYRWMLYQPTLTEADALDRCRRSILFQKDHHAWFEAPGKLSSGEFSAKNGRKPRGSRDH